MDWIFGLLFLLLIGFLICITEIIRKKTHATSELTRKVVHIVTGLFIATTPFIFKSYYPMLIIACLFIPLNYYAIQWNKLNSIHSTERKSFGTVFYPLSFLILTYLLWDHYKVVLIISFLILSLGDALASIVGNSVKRAINYKFGGELKSIQGSLTIFVSSIVIVFLCSYFLGYIDTIHLSIKHSLWIAIITAIIVTACESVSYRGSDNLTVPLGAAFTVHFMITHYPHNLGFSLGVILALLIAIVSYYLKFLDGGGAIGTFLLGILIFGTGGWKFTLPILTFFILSSLLSKFGKKRKQQLMDTFQKSSVRDIWQVSANGGIAGFIILLWNYFPNDLWYFMYVGSIAAANADTWGTEIGVLSTIKPRHILKFKPVPVGASGGITALGTTGALSGSLIIASIGALFFNNFYIFLLITISGFLGSIVDSILGATIQAQYRCPNCIKITEKTTHCSIYKTNQITGWNIVDNDVVNTICTLCGALFSWIGLEILNY